MRSTTAWVDAPSRSAGGLSEMNTRPLLTRPLQVVPPTEEPSPETAGSDRITLSARCCSSIMVRNEMSVEATDTPPMKPESSCGKKPFGVWT